MIIAANVYLCLTAREGVYIRSLVSSCNNHGSWGAHNITTASHRHQKIFLSMILGKLQSFLGEGRTRIPNPFRCIRNGGRQKYNFPQDDKSRNVAELSNFLVHSAAYRYSQF